MVLVGDLIEPRHFDCSGHRNDLGLSQSRVIGASGSVCVSPLLHVHLLEGERVGHVVNPRVVGTDVRVLLIGVLVAVESIICWHRKAVTSLFPIAERVPRRVLLSG